jgi:hypothetical protein
MAVRLSALCAGRTSFPGRLMVLVSIRSEPFLRAIVRLKRLSQLKNRRTSGIETAIFQLLALCLNQLGYRAPPGIIIACKFFNGKYKQEIQYLGFGHVWNDNIKTEFKD